MDAYRVFLINLDCAAKSLPENFSLFVGRDKRVVYGWVDPETCSPTSGQSIFIVCPYWDADGKQMHYGIPVEMNWSVQRIAEKMADAVERAKVAAASPETWHRTFAA